MPTRLNVRCCCQPERVFGTLEVPAVDTKWAFPLYRKTSTEQFDPNAIPSYKDIEYAYCREIVGTRDDPTVREVAVYSEDRPIEFWREIETFIEGDQV